jgi:hypothetical protein
VISCSNDATVRVWVPAQQRCIQVLEPFPCAATAIASHQSTLFLGGQRGQLVEFSSTTWQVELTFADVSTANFACVHHYFAFDFEVLETSETLYQEHAHAITLLQALRGTFIITGTADGRVSIWTFEFEETFSSGEFSLS